MKRASTASPVPGLVLFLLVALGFAIQFVRVPKITYSQPKNLPTQFQTSITPSTLHVNDFQTISIQPLEGTELSSVDLHLILPELGIDTQVRADNLLSGIQLKVRPESAGVFFLKVVSNESTISSAPVTVAIPGTLGDADDIFYSLESSKPIATPSGGLVAPIFVTARDRDKKPKSLKCELASTSPQRATITFEAAKDEIVELQLEFMSVAWFYPVAILGGAFAWLLFRCRDAFASGAAHTSCLTIGLSIGMSIVGALVLIAAFLRGWFTYIPLTELSVDWVTAALVGLVGGLAGSSVIELVFPQLGALLRQLGRASDNEPLPHGDK